MALAACQSSPPPPAPVELEFDQQAELEALSLPVNEATRVRFLPPLAKSNPSGNFVSGLGLEIRAFNVDPSTGVASGAGLGPALSTAKRTIATQRDTYATVWLALSVALDRKATQYLRLEIRTAGAPNAPVCNAAGPECLGYLDVFAFKGLWLGRQTVPDGFVPVPALVGVLPLAFKVLAEEAPPVEGPPPATLGELTSLAGAPFDETVGNCASSYLYRPSQGLQAVGAGLQAVGAVGGLFQGATAGFGGTLADPADVAAEMRTALRSTTSKRNAVLFVVDDFRNGYELPAAIFQANPDLQALAGQVSHGALVLSQLRRMAPVMLPGSTWKQGTGPDGQPYHKLVYQGRDRLYLQPIDVGAYDTDLIPGKIRSAMTYYGSGQDTKSMVVNMSFAIVPCSVLNDFESTAGLATFQDYVAALAAQNGVGQQYLADLDKLVSAPVGLATDPLLAYLACPLPSQAGQRCDGGKQSGKAVIDNLFQVASSGNYGNDYALYPAASEYVISVGALALGSGGDYAPAAYSNAAEVAAPGGLYTLSSVADQTVAYAGTSFAAPVVSLYLAVDSMMQPSRCPKVDVKQSPAGASWLASGAYDMLSFYTPYQSTGNDALSHYCVMPN